MQFLLEASTKNENASIEKFESSLVAQGFNQTEGLNYFERFSLVAKLSTLRVLMALVSLYMEIYTRHNVT
jgi:hypothetical protein